MLQTELLERYNSGERNFAGAALSDNSEDLAGANLSNIILSGADLSHVNFTGTNLHGAELVGSQLWRTSLRGLTSQVQT